MATTTRNRRKAGGTAAAVVSKDPAASKQQPEPRPPSWKVWTIAARPHTLTASLAPNIVGYNVGVAMMDVDIAAFRTLTFQWTAFCMLMQLGTNLHNDYADFVKGADTKERVGQARATQKGWLSPTQTANAAAYTLSAGFVLGLSFLYQMKDANTTYKSFTTFIILSSIFNAFAYTGGEWPLGMIGCGNVSLGYSGLGDLFVLLYFGLVATMMLPFLYVTIYHPQQDLHSTLQQFLPYAIQVATLATNIIVVNNLRDRHTDVKANKRTLAVRLGATFCKLEYAANLLVAYGILLWQASQHDNNDAIAIWKQLLPLLTAKLAYKEYQAISSKEGSALNPHVGGAAKVQLFFCVLLAISVRIS